jgi:hypothetical protein
MGEGGGVGRVPFDKYNMRNIVFPLLNCLHLLIATQHSFKKLTWLFNKKPNRINAKKISPVDSSASHCSHSQAVHDPVVALSLRCCCHRLHAFSRENTTPLLNALYHTMEHTQNNF